VAAPGQVAYRGAHVSDGGIGIPECRVSLQQARTPPGRCPPGRRRPAGWPGAPSPRIASRTGQRPRSVDRRRRRWVAGRGTGAGRAEDRSCRVFPRCSDAYRPERLPVSRKLPRRKAVAVPQTSCRTMRPCTGSRPRRLRPGWLPVLAPHQLRDTQQANCLEEVKAGQESVEAAARSGVAQCCGTRWE
jgi:hypothetical protein